MDALAGDLRENFRFSGPDAEEMFILHRHASRNQTLGLVGRELLVEVSIPAQLRQVHNGLLIESLMAYTLRPSLTPTKTEVGDFSYCRLGNVHTGVSKRYLLIWEEIIR